MQTNTETENNPQQLWEKSLTHQQYEKEKLQQLCKIEKLFQRKICQKHFATRMKTKQKNPKVIGRQQQHHQMQTLITIKKNSLIFFLRFFFINFLFIVSLNFKLQYNEMELALISNSPNVD